MEQLLLGDVALRLLEDAGVAQRQRGVVGEAIAELAVERVERRLVAAVAGQQQQAQRPPPQPHGHDEQAADVAPAGEVELLGSGVRVGLPVIQPRHQQRLPRGDDAAQRRVRVEVEHALRLQRARHREHAGIGGVGRDGPERRGVAREQVEAAAAPEDVHRPAHHHVDEELRIRRRLGEGARRGGEGAETIRDGACILVGGLHVRLLPEGKLPR